MSLPATQSPSDIPPIPLGSGNIRRGLSLRLKLPMAVILILLVAFLISTVLTIRATQTALIDTLQGELIAQVDSKVQLIRSNLIWTRTASVDLATSAEAVAHDESAVLRAIKNTLKHNEQIFGSAIAYEPYQFKPDIYYWSPYFSRTSGIDFKFTQFGNPEYDYLQREWYTLPKTNQTPVLSSPYYDEEDGIWLVTWSAPFYDESGLFKGVARADIPFSQTQDIINGISLGQNGYAFLLDPQGVILGIGSNGGNFKVMEDSMSSLPQSIPAGAGETSILQTILNPSQTTDWGGMIASMVKGETGFAQTVDANRNPVFVAYAPIGLDTGWSLGLAFPQNELLAKASQLQGRIIVYVSLVVVAFAILLYLYTRTFTEPLRRLAAHVSRFSPDQLNLIKGQDIEPIKIETRDELEDLSAIFNQITAGLAHTFANFERGLAERTGEIERRRILLKAVSDVGKAITSFRNLSELLEQTTYLIHEYFGYYHVGIFLVDERKEYAILVATNSEGGQRLLAKKHRLKIGETGLVGYVTENAKARIALDVGKDAYFFNNPDLPQTRSEVTLPLVVGGQMLGALDVQSTESQAFSEEDSSTLQILAEQLAIAIQNANLYDQTAKALEASRTTYGEISREAWSKILRSQPRIGFVATPPATIQTNAEKMEPALATAFESGNLVIGEDKLTISLPIKVRGQAIGAIRLKKNEISEAWTQEETNLAQTLSDQLSGALESARLYRESQQRGARESLISDISARISAVSNTDTIVRETVQELGQALGNATVTFQLLNSDNIQPTQIKDQEP
ncbi:MAG: GAF domain-containing protein [Chloroflexi bacterium]|nr:GAF domain-containing protein [Chloroflexota bacterium]